MQYGLMLLAKVLLCVCIFRCYAAPPINVHQNSDEGASNRYTEVEDQCIIDELSVLLDDYIEGRSRKLWDTVEKKFNENVEAGTPGFQQERTARGLRARFQQVLMHNHVRNNVKVPESLKQKYNDRKTGREKEFTANRDFYTPIEDDFIIQELMKSSHTHIVGSWKKIKAAHDRKRLSNTHGFETERNTRSLKKHVLVMKKRGQLPQEIINKFKAGHRRDWPLGLLVQGKRERARAVHVCYDFMSPEVHTVVIFSGASTSEPPIQEMDLEDADEELTDDQVAEIILQLKDSDIKGDATK